MMPTRGQPQSPTPIGDVTETAPADDAAAIEATAADVVAAEPAEPPAPAAETDEVAAAAAAQTAALLHRFRPGQNLDAEIEAYEREQAALEAERAAAERRRRTRPPSSSRWSPPRGRRRDRRTGRGRRRAGRRAHRRRRHGRSRAGRVGRRRADRRRRAGRRPAAARRGRRARRTADRHRRTADLADRRPGRSMRPRTVPPMTPPSRLRTAPAAVAGEGARMAGPRPGDERAAVPGTARPADRRPRVALGRVEPRSRLGATGPRAPSPGRRPAVRQLRAVTLRHRPVLPPVRDLPGRLTERRRSSVAGP